MAVLHLAHMADVRSLLPALRWFRSPLTRRLSGSPPGRRVGVHDKALCSTPCRRRGHKSGRGMSAQLEAGDAGRRRHSLLAL
jgi:hypothetical protein